MPVATDTVIAMKVRYTWSRFSANPIEHVARDDMFAQPMCGTLLNVGYQHFEDQPSGLAPLCPRCQHKLKKLESLACT